MNVLRIFGIVVAVHAFAFLLIMANPGCSTKSKSTASVAPQSAAPATDPSASPFAPVTAGATSAEGLNFDQGRFSPTRPNTPAATAVAAEPVADVTPATTITVGRGDSLWSIAKKHGIAVTELAAANNLKTGATLQVGQKLVVPSKSGASTHSAPTGASHAAAPAAQPSKSTEVASETVPAAKVSGSSTRHVVKAGETLGSIARKYGVKSGDIAVANNITNPASLRVGRELVIPGGASSKSAKTAPVSGATESRPAETAPAAEAPAATANQAPVMPIIGGPSSEQDLDAGLKAAPASNVPVIKIEETP